MIRRPPNSTLFPYPPLSRSRLPQLAQRLLQIDDVDAGTFGEDEPPHLRIPPARLMAEVDPCFQQFLQLRLRHALPFRVLPGPPSSSPPVPCAAGTHQRIERRVCLPLAELEPLPRARAARLLPLHRARIARQQTVLTQLFAVPLVGQHERARNPEAHGTRLARHTAAAAQRADVEGAESVRSRKRLLNVRHERRSRAIVTQAPPVHVQLPPPRRQLHA